MRQQKILADFVLKIWKKRLNDEISSIKRLNTNESRIDFEDKDELRNDVRQIFGDIQDEFMQFLYDDFESRESEYRDGALYNSICDLRCEAEDEIIEYYDSLG